MEHRSRMKLLQMNGRENQLIPADAFIKFKENHVFSIDAVRVFAGMIHIAPGIVVGRLQNEGEIKHNMLNELKETLCYYWVILSKLSVLQK